MRILVAPDSFKGSLSAAKVGQVIKAALIKEIPIVEVDVIPMADGGEGTIDAFLAALGGRQVEVTVTGATGKKIQAYYGVIEKLQTVVIEVATIVGLPLVPEEKRNPLYLTTYGVGECIRDALDQGFRRFIIGLGGSATNDGGLGMLQALGVEFLDERNNPLAPYASALAQVHRVDYGALDPRLQEAELYIAGDVNNPLCGLQGATHIFGPQKGATPQQIEDLDEALSLYARCIENQLGRVYQDIPGAGAAGGLGFALLTLGATMKSGAELVAQMANFQQRLVQAQWLITGEGRTDGQTLRGKLPYMLAKQAKQLGVPTILVSGALAGDLEPLYETFHSMHSIANGPLSLAESIQQVEYLLYHKTRNIARLLV